MMYLLLGLLGLCFGSFVNALVWRLHEKRDFVRERSECTHCHHVLEWYDLLPVVSWLSLRGKCRYCHKAIEDSPIVELAVMVLFVVSYMWWPYGLSTNEQVVLFVLWLISLVMLVALTLYDLRWMLLPDVLTYPLAVIGLVIAYIRWNLVSHISFEQTVVTAIAGIASVGGLYGLLYVISRGKWVGLGDVKLGIFMGLVLGWQQGILAVFLANVIGIIIILPMLLKKKVTVQSHIPFGPFLIAGCIISILWGNRLIEWYLSYTLY